MISSRPAWVISALFVLAACTRSHLDGGNEATQPSETVDDAEQVDATVPAAGSAAGLPNAGSGGAVATPVSDAAVTPEVTADAAGSSPPVTAGSEAVADVLATLAQGPVVWIGQLRSPQATTCKLGAPATDTWDPINPELDPDGYFERVVIIAQGDPDTGALAVRITFGEGVPPASPADLPPLTADDPFWICYFQLPTAGFEYTGLDPFLSNGRLRFMVAPNELWDPWCESRQFGCDGPCEDFPDCYCGDDLCEPQFPYQIEMCQHDFEESGCVCENGSCWASLKQRFFVDLMVTDEGLEGVSFLGDMRLRRVAP